MTREEIQEALMNGERVKHEYYGEGEWLEWHKDHLVTEDGYHHGTFTDDFWSKYNWWEDGWHIVNKEKS